MKEYKFNEIKKDDETSFLYDINEEKMQQFLNITGDSNVLHTNLDYALENGYKEKVVYGLLTSSALSTLAGMYMPGKYSLIHSIETHFLKPVFLSECPLKVCAKVIEKDERFQQITLKFSIHNIKEEKVCRGIMKIGVIK